MFLLLLLTLSVSADAASAQEEQANPVVDRVILKSKKKKTAAPVVDRVILKKKKTPPPVQAPIESPVALPSGVGEEVEESYSEDAEAEAPIAPVGTALHLSVLGASLERTHLGLGHWYNDRWGFSISSGFRWSREDGPTSTVAGTRRVSAVKYALVPEAALLYSPFQRKELRLVLEGGGGISISKAPRIAKIDVIYHGFAGPSIQWHVARPFSLQLGERVELKTNSKPIRYEVGLSTQLTASWWFE